MAEGNAACAAVTGDPFILARHARVEASRQTRFAGRPWYLASMTRTLAKAKKQEPEQGSMFDCGAPAQVLATVQQDGRVLVSELS